MTDRYAVVGNPIGHSLSPAIHAHFARAAGQNLRYDAFEAPIGGFGAAADDFFGAGGKGLNVTVPFKRDAYLWTARHDDAAAGAGAVNTVLIDPDGARRGCNTDGAGLVRDIVSNLGWPLDGARTLILGAGGAARGIVLPLRGAGAREVTIANRNREKAGHLAQRFGVAACGLDDIAPGWDLVVNATSAGLAGIGGILPQGSVRGSRCYDLSYAADGATPFCAWAARQGAAAVGDGLGMLVEQAAEAFRLWRGTRPETAPVLAALRRCAAQ